MPPCTPPELFVVVRILPARVSNASLCCEPRICVAPNPEPISKRFRGRNAQHRFRQVCFELVEHGLAKSGWDAARHALDHAADGVACIPNLLDQRDHLFRSGSIRAADDIFLNVIHCHGGTVNLRRHFMDLRHVSDEIEVRVQGGQYFFCNRTRRDATNRFARRRATAALPVSDSVFGLVSVIGVRRSKFARDFAVIFGSSVFVPNENCDRRPERSAFKNAGQKFASVFLFALRCQLL